MIVLVTCKNEEDPIENVGARVFTLYTECQKNLHQVKISKYTRKMLEFDFWS